jgi:demethylmenaquinone methyltransferase / 2-methoxy-6-polyprenyl-1,4-benzoquinol methylase
MSDLTGEERSRYVQGMFGRIADRYDLMNRVMTFGQDSRWRREVIALADLKQGGVLLDLGSGTGDLVRECLKVNLVSQAVAADFTEEMMQIGRSRHPDSDKVDWLAADALHLPFPDESFDAVVSAFLLRNVADLRQALAEQYRVLKPGGRLVCLDTTPPKKNILSPFIDFHLHVVIPLLGKWIAGEASAYQYLPETTAKFVAAERLAARFQETGLQQVSFKLRMFGTIAIHWGHKPWE